MKQSSTMKMISGATCKEKTRILTVGDGDLSLSLALARAYGKCISLTASVLDSEDDLLKAYPCAPIKELQSRNVDVLYGLDGTQLHHRFPSKSWDLTCFHHPHLGLASLDTDEAEHANRHFILLCHYLYSAQQVSEFVHICLCGTQPDTWRLLQAADYCSMHLIKKFSTSAPFSKLWTEGEVAAAEMDPNFSVPRRYRNGRLGSRHMLGKYGYRHRRTEGERYKGKANDTNVAGSMHYVFKFQAKSTMIKEAPKSLFYTCDICRSSFPSEHSLSLHMNAPAMPAVQPTTVADTNPRFQTQGELREDKIATLKSISCIDLMNTNQKKLEVSKEHSGKRLRWFIQHGIPDLSKRKAEVSIQAGLVKINNTVVMDSSRILDSDDIIIVSLQEAVCSSLGPNLEIVHRKPPVLVVFKPLGMRTKGDFPGTLESTLSEQEGSRYSSLSPLETSCAGLCALVQTGHEGSPPVVVHSMTALIYGKLPDYWYPFKEVTINVEPKWKKRKHSENAAVNRELLKLFPVATTKMQKDHVPMTTLRIETYYPCSSSLCRFLRLEGFGVVGDSFCRKEYLQLKRSIRNRIKDKLCIGCYEIQVDGVLVSHEVPQKLLASFWDAHYEHGESKL
eukprot:scaffold160_cov136-Cylindrotheca_fusiformis.AAC.6